MDGYSQTSQHRPLVDHFGRHITYLRLSVTDRCDLRCVYCMKARPDFLPKSELLTLEELTQLADAFIRRGVSKIRITGNTGEPARYHRVEETGGRLGLITSLMTLPPKSDAAWPKREADPWP